MNEWIINELTDLYMLYGEFQDCFTIEKYLEIIIQETNYINDTPNQDEQDYQRRFFYVQFNPSERFCIVRGLLDSVSISIEGKREQIQIRGNIKPVFALERDIERLEQVLRLLLWRAKEIKAHRKYYIDDIRAGIKDFSFEKRITHLKKLVTQCKNDENFKCYTYYYNQFIKDCETEISNIQEDFELESAAMTANPDYFIDANKILKLSKLLTDSNIVKDIAFRDFLACFDVNNKPAIYPEYNNQNPFIYVLSSIKGDRGNDLINEKIAYSHFGIKDYKSKKSQVKKKYIPAFAFKNQVDRIFNIENVSVTKKI